MDHLASEVFTKAMLEAVDEQEEAMGFLAVIQRLAENLPRNVHQGSMCAHFVRVLIEETSFENASIFFCSHDGKKLAPVATFGLETQLSPAGQGLGTSPGSLWIENIAASVFSSQQPEFLENRASDVSQPENGTGIPASIACIPLMHLGVLIASASHALEFTPQTRRNWEIVGNIMAYILLSLEPKEKSHDGLRVAGNRRPETNSSLFEDQVLNSMPHGICSLDKEGKVVYYNARFERILGEDPLKLTRLSPAVIFQDPRIFEKLLPEAATSGEAQETNVKLIDSSGEAYFADVHLVRLGDQSGVVSGYLFVTEDVTRKKDLFDKVAQSQKLAALGAMAGGVSHDFNNLLMAVLGNIQLALPHIEDDEVRRRLQNVEKAVSDGSNTVRRLQRFTQREQDPLLMTSSIDVSEALQDVIDLTRPRWKNSIERCGHSIAIKHDLAQNCFAAINASDLKEVFTNLVLNAVDAMPRGGVIIFRTRCEGERVIIEIADTGIGMAKETAEKIFDPFFTTKGVSNSGLGLSVSWSLIESYGGDIRVKSKPGRGTTFTITLGRAEPAGAQIRPGASRETESHYLLLVDDDPDILNILRDMLRLKGHKVVATPNGEKALELIKSHDFDMVLTDLGMPVVSGWDIAKQSKAKNPKTPVVMITGWGTQYEDEDLCTRGVDLMLAKPLSWEKMMTCIEEML